MGYSYALVGNLTAAKRHATQLDRLFPGVPYTRQLLSLIDGLEGRGPAALERLAPVNLAVLDPHQWFHLAESFIVAGDVDRGLDLLERSNAGFHPYGYMAHYCRFLDPVRGLPRFQGILEQAHARTDALREALASSTGI